MKIGVAADHGGCELKQKIQSCLAQEASKFWTSAICDTTRTMTVCSNEFTGDLEQAKADPRVAVGRSASEPRLILFVQ